MAEDRIQYDIRVALGLERDLVLWRNPVGVAQHGRGAATRYGLIVGASDSIGILTLRAGDLPPDDLVGRFFAMEFKREKGGRFSEAQLDFINLVRRRGGCAFPARSVDEARAALARARKGAIE